MFLVLTRRHWPTYLVGSFSRSILNNHHHAPHPPRPQPRPRPWWALCLRMASMDASPSGHLLLSNVSHPEYWSFCRSRSHQSWCGSPTRRHQGRPQRSLAQSHWYKHGQDRCGSAVENLQRKPLPGACAKVWRNLVAWGLGDEEPYKFNVWST